MSYSVSKSAIKKLQRQRSINSEVTLHERPTSKTYNNKSTEIMSGVYRVIFGKSFFGESFYGEEPKAFTRKLGKGLNVLPVWIHVSVNR